jgi:predicted Kef-type K+ transport protein
MKTLILAAVMFLIVALPFFWPTFDRYRRKLKTRRARARRAELDEN